MSCPGCQNNESNQLAHMNQPNGCLYTSIEEEVSNILAPRNLEPEFENTVEQTEKPKEKDLSICTGKPIFALPCNVKLENCAICLDDILEMVNVTVTTCGHTFHSSCIFESVKKSADCPLCRHELLEYDEEEDEEDDEEEYEEDDDDEEEEDQDEAFAGLRALFQEEGEEEEPEITAEQIATKLQSMGYSLADFIKLYLYPCPPSTNEARYTEDFEIKMDQDIEDIVTGKIPIHVEEAKVEVII